jgi:chromosomal replication initiation ATPase DnaA
MTSRRPRHRRRGGPCGFGSASTPASGIDSRGGHSTPTAKGRRTITRGGHRTPVSRATRSGPGARSDAGSGSRNAWRSNPVPSCRSASLDLEIGLPLDDRYRLDRFVVGQTNRMAHASATRVVVPEEQGGWKLLFLHGSCGVGKTHLLQGVARRFAEHHPGRRICYTTGERFTNQYIAALRENRIEAFRRALRRIDLLCLDDVHFLANKRATQDELLHTLKSIDLTGARLVIASDEHPQHITRIADHLVSRFMAGVVMGIDPPDEDLRQRLVDEFARRRGLQLAPAVASAVAHLPFASPRELEGAVAKVDAVHQLVMTDGGLTLNREVGMCTFRQAFPQPEPRRRGPIKVTEILDRVSAPDRCRGGGCARQQSSPPCRRRPLDHVLPRTEADDAQLPGDRPRHGAAESLHNRHRDAKDRGQDPGERLRRDRNDRRTNALRRPHRRTSAGDCGPRPQWPILMQESLPEAGTCGQRAPCVGERR